MAEPTYTFVVEHLDPELGPWSALEYRTIAKESKESGCHFILSSVPQSLLDTQDVKELQNVGAEGRTDSIEHYYAHKKEKICLLDPAAKQELEPADANVFGVFLFGGILGDDPPRDRTSELRKKGFSGRRLGPKQMTTDTAVRVTRMVVLDQIPLEKIPYVDFPELKLDEHETTEMPFRYVTDGRGKPIMPEGMIDLIKADADKAFDNLDFADEVEGLENLKVNQP
ncbi:hypothetical protein LTR10_019103 [Elasticomyces elasticus]|uniref:Carboxypeptidase D n=1 Tax=Exophiala sideris TaxID=1016849 RepID=A0ABR0JH45_9EURO|nr:hypothetical protein LTR10_019103 [Elasticomyces elasticus]KAK5033489.1 hypothetical protein LTS07_003793 [Exophiala sideris]KAK5042016.1 hypothetical protein LTR13_001822 [Exophiala sideris]KAK5064033.1 hypothetical protein LTR69_003801 [Exophiala sideris]KAK5185284.1 hypothetical protein LTR44_002273 [Eurotiomycetes sp. CCFEE 6388]